MKRTDRPSRIVILTGAGISAESGLKTFRADDGLWEGHRVEDVCTPEAFAVDPALVYQFYDQRRADAAAALPNAAHRALARLERDWPGEVLIVTQNIDDLHERAGSRDVIHMHGQGNSGWCLACDERFAWTGAMDRQSACPICGASGRLRPDIVWFGEMPYAMDLIEDALRDCDLFVSIGTSGSVYPAAGFVQTARYCGARTLELNLEPSQGSLLFDDRDFGPATSIVPAWVDELLQSVQSSPMSS